MNLPTKAFKKDEYLIRENDSDNNIMYIIVEGKLQVLIYDEKTEKKVEVATLGQNDFVGENGLLFNKKRQADVVALTDVTVISIESREMLVQFIKQNPEFAIGMIMILSGRVEKMTESYVATYGNLQFAKQIIADSVRYRT